MTKKSVKEKIIDTGLQLAAEKGWESVALEDIAERADITLSDIHDYFEDRSDILAAYGKMIDRKVIENIGGSNQDTSPRDRLFDLLMERFDILNENRDGVIAILEHFKCDPAQAVMTLPYLGRSMCKMLNAANTDTGGICGALKAAGLTAIYLNTLRTWKTDDSPDMAKTMAALDKGLEKAEYFSRMSNE